MPSEFSVHSWIFEVHSKNSDCILSALQIFGPNRSGKISNGIRSVFWLQSDCVLNIFTGLYGILTAFETFWSHSRENRNDKPLQILPECPECASNEPECTSNASRLLAGIYFDIKRIQLECNSNAVGIFRMRIECSRNVPICPRMSPDVIQNTTESHIQEYINNFHSVVIPAHSASSVTGVWNSLPNVARIWKIFIPLVRLDSCWFRISVTGGYKRWKTRKSRMSHIIGWYGCSLKNLLG